MIRLSKSVVGRAEADAVAHIIEDIGYLGMGATVGELEQQLAAYIGGGRRALCVNSGTAALHLALQAVTRPGDEVLVPSFTFVATYQAIRAAGCKPVSCDIRPDTLTLDLADAERRITPRTTAMMPVYYASNSCMAPDYQAFAREHGLRLVEDAAHSFGCSCQGRKISSFGDVVCFSFDGIKNITTGEGGAVLTADEDVIQKVSDARLLGVQKDSEKRYAGQRSWQFDVVDQGYRYHMSNIFAAIGLVQLSRFEREFAPRRRAIAQRYINNGYELFTRRCADGRKMKQDDIKKIGEGRVWTGIHAKQIGLVDELAGLDAAIAKAMELAKIDDASIMNYPAKTTVFEQLMEEMQGTSYADKQLQQALGDYYPIWSSMKNVRQKTGIQAALPYFLKFNL